QRNVFNDELSHRLRSGSGLRGGDNSHQSGRREKEFGVALIALTENDSARLIPIPSQRAGGIRSEFGPEQLLTDAGSVASAQLAERCEMNLHERAVEFGQLVDAVRFPVGPRGIDSNACCNRGPRSIVRN